MGTPKKPMIIPTMMYPSVSSVMQSSFQEGGLRADGDERTAGHHQFGCSGSEIPNRIRPDRTWSAFQLGG